MMRLGKDDLNYSCGMPDATPAEAFAALIREGRRRRGMTQEELETASGVSRATLSRWERSLAESPDAEHVRAVCAILGIDPRQAALTLGYLGPEDIEPPTNPAVDPLVQEALDILTDVTVPREEKERWIDYLKFIQQKHRARGNQSQAS